MRPITRRQALDLCARTLGVGGLSLSARSFDAFATTDLEQEQPLSSRAARKGILYGAATLAQQLAQDPAHALAFARECGMLVTQNELKWGPLRPAPKLFRFEHADWLQAFARKHKLAFRGHCLVWHIGNPDWLTEALQSERAGKLLDEHIWAVAGRYRGLMHSWDVVNEAIRIKDGRNDGLRETIWLKALGPGYIERAFRVAAEADPSALLVYNDFDLEYAERGSTQKRNAVLRFLERLKKNDVPVHALGLQAHLDSAQPLEPSVLTRLLDEVSALGLHVFITELDVDDHRLPRSIRRRDEGVAKVYRAYLETALGHPAVSVIATWGLSDKYTWLNEPEYKHFGWTARPLPLDVNMRRKQAWRAMSEAFDGASRRAPLPDRLGRFAPALKAAGALSGKT
jgi:endo-1,4-beta-xylanase